jgi:hypothetical protein
VINPSVPFTATTVGDSVQLIFKLALVQITNEKKKKEKEKEKGKRN